MLIFDKPYVSELLAQTAEVKSYYVLKNEMSIEVSDNYNLNLIDSESALEKINSGTIGRIYSNSENALNWLNENINEHSSAIASEIFKNKTRFRKDISGIYNDFFFKEVSLKELRDLNINEIKKPFIIKPSVGFFSIGVYKVENDDQWDDIVTEIVNETSLIASQYPDAVVKVDKFLIEDFIEGEELAIDAYFDNDGEAVILNILHHIYSSGSDVKDRVYKTSIDIVKKYSPVCLSFLKEMGRLFNLENFPFHIELRVDEKYRVVPVEVNPLRFAGWCTTDMAYYAYGINNYEYFMDNLRPDWDKIAKGRENKIYSIVIGDMPEDIKKKNVKKYRYDDFFGRFSNVLHRRIIEDNDYSVFAFAFVENTAADISEVDEILYADFSVFMEL